MCVPGRAGFGTLSWSDLRGKYSAALTNMTAAGAWGGPVGRPGGWGSLRFNESGTDDYVSATVSEISGESQHTYAAWVRVVASTGTNQTIIRVGIMEGTSRRIDFLDSGAVTSNYYLDGTTTSATGLWSVGRWHRVVSTQNASTQTVYLDGRSVASSARTPPSYSSGACSIGRRATSGAFQYPCNAQIDDVVILSRAWSASEVAEDWKLGKQHAPGLLNRRSLAYGRSPQFVPAWAAGSTYVAGVGYA
jgi:hypothetical protein